MWSQNFFKLDSFNRHFKTYVLSCAHSYQDEKMWRGQIVEKD